MNKVVILDMPDNIEACCILNSDGTYTILLDTILQEKKDYYINADQSFFNKLIKRTGAKI